MSRHRAASVLLVYVLLLSLGFLVAAAERPNEPKDLDLVDGQTYTHEPSGMRYPAEAGQFKRRGGTQYDLEGRNVSVSYLFDEARLLTTVYAYPAGDAGLDDHMKQVKGDLTNFYPNAKLEKEGPWDFRQGKNAYLGLQASYLNEMEIEGEPTKVVQRLQILKLGEFFVKVRTTYPASDRAAADKALDAFVKALKLPPPSKAKPNV